MQTTSIQDFNDWLKNPEGRNLEFKEAKGGFNRDKDLPDYCAALANEGGGKLILGVNDARVVVATKAFLGTHNTLAHILWQSLKIKIDVEEILHPAGRVLVFHIPAHPVGVVVQSSGHYKHPMRVGESLVEMDPGTFRKIVTEVDIDFSAKIVSGVTVADIDEEAVKNFLTRWAQKSRRSEYLTFSVEQTLSSIEFLSDKGINYAALVLFGKKEKIDELLPTSEIIFEWRQDSAKTSHDYRINWRASFFRIYDEVWSAISARNLRIPFQDGLFQREIYAFDEKAIREALLNAVTHRDYSISGQSIFIKASPQEFSISSPGGFPAGITLTNILNKSTWRNRRIAEAFEKAGMVERSGQGMNVIFESTIRDGKGCPDLSQSDQFEVLLKIPAQVKDKGFIEFLEKISKEKQESFSAEELYELEHLRESGSIANISYREKFLSLGVIEKIGKTSGIKYVLSHKYYKEQGQAGIHTRLAGLTRDKNKELILGHLRKNKRGCMREFQDAFVDLKRGDVSNLLQELKRDGRIRPINKSKGSYWVLVD